MPRYRCFKYYRPNNFITFGLKLRFNASMELIMFRRPGVLENRWYLTYIRFSHNNSDYFSLIFLLYLLIFRLYYHFVKDLWAYILLILSYCQAYIRLYPLILSYCQGFLCLYFAYIIILSRKKSLYFAYILFYFAYTPLIFRLYPLIFHLKDQNCQG